MSLQSFLSDFSLPEIFQFVEKGQKSGLLSISALPESQASKGSFHYIWVHQGHVVAAANIVVTANRLEHLGLVSLIKQRQWVSESALDKLAPWCDNRGESLGQYLFNQGVLQGHQLKHLFSIQVLQQVCAVFQLKDGQVQFDQNVSIPAQELTGLSVPATEATLMGLRALSHWDALVDKLPEPSASLVSLVAFQPQYQLETLEALVWEYADGTVSLDAIAQQLRLPVEKVQRIAFRMSAVGLVAVQQGTLTQAKSLKSAKGALLSKRQEDRALQL